MKSLFLLLGLLLVGCATTDTPPPEIPIEELHGRVLEADQEWAWYVSMDKPNGVDAAAVASARNVYEKSLTSKDDKQIRKTAENYIGLVNELMVPPLAPRPKKPPK